MEEVHRKGKTPPISPHQHLGAVIRDTDQRIPVTSRRWLCLGAPTLSVPGNHISVSCQQVERCQLTLSSFLGPGTEARMCHKSSSATHVFYLTRFPAPADEVEVEEEEAEAPSATEEEDEGKVQVDTGTLLVRASHSPDALEASWG